MSGNERLDSRSGPLGNLSQTYFGSLDMVVKGCEPALKGVGRWNLELMGLMSRRAQAWQEVPSRLSQCKTPMDAVNEQMRFWQTAASHYADGAHRLAAAFGACAMMPGLDGAWGSKAAAQPRDYITFPEAKEPAAGDGSRRSDRKAA